MQLESDIQEKVTYEATLMGFVPIRINVTGRKGWPDYGYGYKGRVLFIEFKRPGEKPEPLQEYVHLVLREHEFTVAVVDNVGKGIKILEDWKRELDRI